MKWNLRLAAANRGIWKASEFQRMLAERGLVISAGKMSGLWSGNPNMVKLDELDIICAVLGCGVEELLLPEPDTVPQPHPGADEHTAAIGEARPGGLTPRPTRGNRRASRQNPACTERKPAVIGDHSSGAATNPNPAAGRVRHARPTETGTSNRHRRTNKRE
jgi:DNA-binding Xre family transcriptional regulator